VPSITVVRHRHDSLISLLANIAKGAVGIDQSELIEALIHGLTAVQLKEVPHHWNRTVSNESKQGEVNRPSE
jgi:hypothetical protein